MAVKLSPIEAQRTVAIIEDALEKLAFLGSITPDVLSHRDELSQFVDEDISRIINEQRMLERRYEELIAQRGTLKGLANKSKYKENQADIQDVSRALRESTKNLCRNLKDNPNISGNLIKIQNERSELQDLLSRTARELRERRTFQTLLSQVEEEKIEQDRLEEIIQREKETAASVRKLEEDLNIEKMEHEKEVKERKRTIANLKEELHEIRSKTTVKARYARKEAEAKTASTLRTYQEVESKLEKETDRMKKLCDMEESVHNDTVAFLKRKKDQLVKQSAEWSDKYTRDMEKMDLKLQQLVTAREKDLALLNQLQERWEQELAEKAAAEAEERRLIEYEELKKAESVQREVAASKIQRAFRRHLKAKELSKKSKKGAKGKKDKKGKKKKK